MGRVLENIKTSQFANTNMISAQIQFKISEISKKSINNGLKKTIWPGRLEKGYLKNIPVFLDGAHNVAGAQQLAKFLSIEKN